MHRKQEATAVSRARQDAAHGDLHVPVGQQVEKADAAGLDQADLDAGPRAAVSSQKCGDDALHRLRRRADPKAPGRSSREGPCPFAHCIGPGQHVSTPFQELLTFGGEPDSATDAVEEADAELGLEVADLSRERRLADVDPKRGLRHARRFGDADEVPEMPQLHRHLIPSEHGL
jgi:hypothetical protein